METAADLSLIDPMAPVPFIVLQRREGDPRHLHHLARASRAIPLPSRPVQHALPVRHRRVGDFDQWQPGGPTATGAHHQACGECDRGARSTSTGRCRRGQGPFGTQWPLDAARGGDLVFVAGGIGLAPLRPAIARAVAHRDDYRRVVVLIGARTPADIVFSKQVQEWHGQFDLEVGVTVDAANQAWRGPVGVVTTLIPGADFDPAATVALVCGPEIMMRFTAAALVKRGVTADRIHVSVERNMKCGIGFCGHCQFGPYFVCRDGPVFRYDRVERLLTVKEV